MLAILEDFFLQIFRQLINKIKFKIQFTQVGEFSYISYISSVLSYKIATFYKASPSNNSNISYNKMYSLPFYSLLSDVMQLI